MSFLFGVSFIRSVLYSECPLFGVSFIRNVGVSLFWSRSVPYSECQRFHCTYGSVAAMALKIRAQVHVYPVYLYLAKKSANKIYTVCACSLHADCFHPLNLPRCTYILSKLKVSVAI